MPSSRIAKVVFALVYLPILLGIIVPFITYNQVINWDAAGHLAAAQFIHDQLFPYWSGWNPQYFAGFPQGIFYSPLFHYLVAALGFIVPIKLAFKILVVLSILLTPFSFYRYARSLKLPDVDAAYAMAAMTGLVAAPLVFASNNNAIGGTFNSTFYVGLVASAWALPLGFFYAASLPQLNSRNGRIKSSLLMALIVLSHFVTALAICIYSIIYALLNFRSWFLGKAFLTHGLEVFCLTAIWIVPFIVFLPFSETVHIRLSLGPASFAILTLGLFLTFALFMRARANHNGEVVAYFLFLTLGLLWLNFYPIRFHIYRLILFPVLMVPILYILAVPRKLNWILGVIGVTGIFWGVSASFEYDSIYVTGPRQVTRSALAIQPANRTLVVSSGPEQLSAHFNQIELPTTYNFWAGKGLFVEASRNSRFILTLEKILDPESMTWGVERPDNSIVPLAQQKLLATKLLRSLGFNGIIATKELPNLESISRQPLFSYDRPLASLLWKKEDKENPDSYLRLWGEAQYFIVRDNELLMVEESFGFRRFTPFKIGLPSGYKFVLETPEVTYYVKRLDRDLLRIEFALPTERVVRGPLPSTAPLREAIEMSIPSDIDRQGVFSLIDHLDDTLANDSEAFAQAQFRDAPHISLDPEEKVTLADYASVMRVVPHKFFFDYYELQPTPSVESVSNSRLISIPHDKWSSAVGWWSLDSLSDAILVNNSNDRPIEFGDSTGAAIENLKVSSTGDRIEFDAKSSSPSPILVRTSYFPKWKAWADGKPTKVYEASPSVMLVNANGHVVLRYQTLWLEYSVAALSLIATIYCLLTLAKHR